jgi:hypothetical protein
VEQASSQYYEPLKGTTFHSSYLDMALILDWLLTPLINSPAEVYSRMYQDMGHDNTDVMEVEPVEEQNGGFRQQPKQQKLTEYAPLLNNTGYELHSQRYGTFGVNCSSKTKRNVKAEQESVDQSNYLGAREKRVLI